MDRSRVHRPHSGRWRQWSMSAFAGAVALGGSAAPAQLPPLPAPSPGTSAPAVAAPVGSIEERFQRLEQMNRALAEQLEASRKDHAEQLRKMGEQHAAQIEALATKYQALLRQTNVPA